MVIVLHERKRPCLNEQKDTVNNSTNGKVIKHFGAVFPRVRVSVFSVDFIVEPIDCGNLSESINLYLDSWFPLRRVIRSGYFTFRQRRY